MALRALHRRFGSWRNLAEILGFNSAGYWRDVAAGRRRMSRQDEDRLRFILGLAPKGQPQVERWSEATMRRYWRERMEVRVTGCPPIEAKRDGHGE